MHETHAVPVEAADQGSPSDVHQAVQHAATAQFRMLEALLFGVEIIGVKVADDRFPPASCCPKEKPGQPLWREAEIDSTGKGRAQRADTAKGKWYFPDSTPLASRFPR